MASRRMNETNEAGAQSGSVSGGLLRGRLLGAHRPGRARAGIAAGIAGAVLLVGGGAAAVAVLPAGCDAQPSEEDRPTHPVSGLPLEKVTIAGKEYTLELALNNDTRFKGLSDRTSIDEDGGMLFVFPRPAVQSFVMRDCPIDIDIIFLDGAGRITATHAMKAEEPQRDDETEAAYNNRLKKYPSRGKAQFVIELKGGTLAKMDPALKRGERIKLDVKELRALARG